ncbi:TlpA family protein disulfide reductase [Microbacterium caowuchunii]|uniref:TlpA family protein disulfide reductase n=1 Tax=Microbacterium caowuchunii TaxID=2614638 RepID=UPI001248EE51|nr:TlpA disulfide reductase family protein [Microbacterium caowuchunii]QEV99152.1 TlpA family protein disulfide reductase [Microbacterium caowuchunii]
MNTRTFLTRAASVTAAAVLALTLGACSSDPLADQYREGSNKGFIGADGLQVVEIAERDRTDPVVFSGVTETGETVTSDDVAGEVVVVNFWYAACGPCIVEAPRLEEAYQAVADEPVRFLGVNTYDQAATVAAFGRDNGVTYPSLLAVDDSELKLAFATATPLSATPTTLVLDKQGRVAARIVGELSEPSILTTLVRDALAESS